MHVRTVLLQVLQRVDRIAVDTDLEMQMRSRAHAGVAGKCDLLSLGHLLSREFYTSFFSVLIQTLYLSHLWLIFLSNFMNFIVLFCTLCGIIKKTDFIIGEKRYVCICYWK